MRAFLEPRDLAVSCISRSILRFSSDRPSAGGFLTFAAENAIRLNGRHGLSFSVLNAYESSRDPAGWTVRSTSYLYHVYARDGREITAFHWHDGDGAPGMPHAHFRQLNAPIPMGKCHIPTGLVSLPTVVRFPIEELAVEPLRPDWAAVLTVAEREASGRSGCARSLSGARPDQPPGVARSGRPARTGRRGAVRD